MIRTAEHVAIERAKALLSMGAMRLDHGAGAYAVVFQGEGSIGVVASSCASILGLQFDLIDGLSPFGAAEYRRNPCLLVPSFSRDPSRDEIRTLVLRTMERAPLSLLAVRARGREVEDFADIMREAHDEFLCSTCHF